MVDQLAIDIPLLVTLIASVIGASLNVLRGYQGEGENKTFDAKKFFTGLIAAVMAGITVAVLLPIGEIEGGVIGLFVAGLMAGFSADFALSKGKK